MHVNVEGRDGEQPPPRPLLVLVVIDGMRADDVSAQVTPTLAGLASDGVWCANARTVTPSVTRAAAASLVTGCLPRRTGILGNRIWMPNGVVNTGRVEELLALRAGGGRVVGAPTLGEMLAPSEQSVIVIGTGSAGCAYLLHPEVEQVGGAVVMATPVPGIGPVLPARLAPVVTDAHGEPPVSSAGSVATWEWAVDVATGPLLTEVDPDVLLLWCGEPDEIRHADGLDAGRAVLGRVDEELARLLRLLQEQGRSVDLIVTSDHGMIDLPPGAHVSPDLFDSLPAHLVERVTVCDSGAAFALHLTDNPPDLVTDLVRWCSEQPWVDQLYAAGAHPEAERARTLAEAGCDHPTLAPTVLLTAHPDRLPIFAAHTVVATHGTSLPEDTGIPMLFHGPRFATRRAISRPIALTDVLPTIITLLRVPDPPLMDGTSILDALTPLTTLPFERHAQ